MCKNALFGNLALQVKKDRDSPRKSDMDNKDLTSRKARILQLECGS